jgi:succinate dehydrogenase / fumarate reductase iron-sulfur subunit
MNLTLKIWRQQGPHSPGRFVDYPVKDVSADMSFLEMLDVLNEDLIQRGEVPIAFEPWRARAFPLVKDLVVDRSAFDKIIQAGGFISVSTGGAPDGNAIPIAKDRQELAMDAAACIGCGACVAVCKNASAMLFVAAKVSHLGLLPQGAVEEDRRALNMVQAMDEAGFGNCTVTRSCEAVCPKQISLDFIARLNRSYLKALTKSRR